MTFLVTFPFTQVIVLFLTAGFAAAETLLPGAADGEGDELGVGAEVATCDPGFCVAFGVGV